MKSAAKRDARVRGLWFMGPPRKLLRAGSRWLKRNANEKKYTPIAEALVCREIPSERGEECQNRKFKTSGGRPLADRLYCRSTPRRSIPPSKAINLNGRLRRRPGGQRS